MAAAHAVCGMTVRSFGIRSGLLVLRIASLPEISMEQVPGLPIGGHDKAAINDDRHERLSAERDSAGKCHGGWVDHGDVGVARARDDRETLVRWPPKVADEHARALRRILQADRSRDRPGARSSRTSVS
jgi:hypothetical protein